MITSLMGKEIMLTSGKSWKRNIFFMSFALNLMNEKLCWSVLNRMLEIRKILIKIYIKLEAIHLNPFQNNKFWFLPN